MRPPGEDVYGILPNVVVGVQCSGEHNRLQRGWEVRGFGKGAADFAYGDLAMDDLISVPRGDDCGSRVG